MKQQKKKRQKVYKPGEFEEEKQQKIYESMARGLYSEKQRILIGLGVVVFIALIFGLLLSGIYSLLF